MFAPGLDAGGDGCGVDEVVGFDDDVEGVVDTIGVDGEGEGVEAHAWLQELTCLDGVGAAAKVYEVGCVGGMVRGGGVDVGFFNLVNYEAHPLALGLAFCLWAWSWQGGDIGQDST